jgi:hypothetical protein
MNASGARTSRVPAGHPEGYIDSFAGLYTEIACHLLARRDGSDLVWRNSPPLPMAYAVFSSSKRCRLRPAPAVFG